jgi:nucleotide-binding universal stress UspA family protein
MNEIVIGYQDDSEGRDAVALGRILAAVTGHRALVAMAFTWPSGLMDDGELERALEGESARPVAAVGEQLAEFDHETRTLACRSAAEAVTELAERRRASVIVIGSAHHGSVGRTLLGSTGQSLVPGAPCAIAIAPRNYADRDGPRLLRVGVAFDGSAESWAALETGIGITERVHGELVLIAVADYPNYGYATSWAVLTGHGLGDFEYEDKQRKLELARGRVPGGVHVEERLLTGRPAALLPETSAELDLLITGSRGYGPLLRTFLGSATRGLVAGSRCPVLILPRAASMDPLGVRDRRRSGGAPAPRGRGRRLRGVSPMYTG